jgi:hypothetical protein
METVTKNLRELFKENNHLLNLVSWFFFGLQEKILRNCNFHMNYYFWGEKCGIWRVWGQWRMEN